MRLQAFAVVVALTAGGIAWAWQYEDEILLDQVGGRPGGGGNFATGGKNDFRVTCTMCHLIPDGGFGGNRISVSMTFNPGLQTAADGGFGYTPGQGYVIDINMNNEHFTLPDGGNPHHNMMAATFENTAGQYVGLIASDTGYSTNGTCPAAVTGAMTMQYDAGSTTVTQAGCRTITGRSRGPNGNNKKTWHFRWTAPAAGQGRVFMYYGVTNGDGDEKTIGDDSIEGVRVMEQM